MVPPLVRLHLTMQTSWRQATPLAISGEPVSFYCNSKEPLRDVFLYAFSLPRTYRQLSGRKIVHTSSLQHVVPILTNHTEFVKQAFILSYFSALQLSKSTEPPAPQTTPQSKNKRYSLTKNGLGISFYFSPAVFIFGWNTNDARYPKIRAADIPTDDAVKPPLKIPIKPSSVTAFFTPSNNACPKPNRGTLAPAPANSFHGP